MHRSNFEVSWSRWYNERSSYPPTEFAIEINRAAKHKASVSSKEMAFSPFLIEQVKNCLYLSACIESKIADLLHSLKAWNAVGDPQYDRPSTGKKCHWHTSSPKLRRQKIPFYSVRKSYWIIRAKILVTFHVAHFSYSYESYGPSVVIWSEWRWNKLIVNSYIPA